MKMITILGSTGSIGTQALDVVEQYHDKLAVFGLSCDKNIALLYNQIQKFCPKVVAVKDIELAHELAKTVKCKVLCGSEGINELAGMKCDTLLNALVGISGLEPTLTAIESGNDIALANKETLVAGGNLVVASAKKHGVQILPVDSEHSAIWQCLDFEKNRKIKKILLTASGGAFANLSKNELINAKAKDALRHPTWVMGAKVTIDSATLMNKGLEIVEAMRLFDKNVEDIKVVVQKQSIVHSMIEYDDGSITAQLSFPDMKLPIQLALLYPERGNYAFNELSFDDLTLNFALPDADRFPCLAIAQKCAKLGGNYCVVMNSANEELSPLYLKDIIKFYDIPYYINMALEKLGKTNELTDVKEIYECDRLTREYVGSIVRSGK